MHIHDHKILIKKNGLLTWKLQNRSGFFVRYPLRILKEWGDYPVSPKASKTGAKSDRWLGWLWGFCWVEGPLQISLHENARALGGPGMVVLSNQNKQSQWANGLQIGALSLATQISNWLWFLFDRIISKESLLSHIKHSNGKARVISFEVPKLRKKL
jgi:hypothetical protein